MLYAVVHYNNVRAKLESDSGYEYSEYSDDCVVDYEILGLFRSKEKAERLLNKLSYHSYPYKIVEVESDL